MTEKIPPFYENFDKTHCTQCAMRGVVEHFEPNEIWSWEEWDRFTNKEPGKWTWPYRAMVNMTRRGYEAVYIDAGNTQEYLDNGIYEMLVRDLGVEAANAQRDHADLDQVRIDMIDYIKVRDAGMLREFVRMPTIDDVRNLLDEGFLLLSSLNPYRLYDREGYSGHTVLVYKVDEKLVYFHNSGLPAVAEETATIETFIAASTDPTPAQWNLTAYKLKST
jgi:hypothetical protein